MTVQKMGKGDDFSWTRIIRGFEFNGDYWTDVDLTGDGIIDVQIHKYHLSSPYDGLGVQPLNGRVSISYPYDGLFSQHDINNPEPTWNSTYGPNGYSINNSGRYAFELWYIENTGGDDIRFAVEYSKSERQQANIYIKIPEKGIDPPNKAPTGNPILTGNLKVGTTISIDASAIEDADNFDGWTPTYEYTWELSDDNGTTWTALASTDATDGDDSYSLTSAEVGKHLRGVVSYVDGYGTNEVVESDYSLVTPVIRGNSIYTEVRGDNYYWSEAQKIAKQLGGNLTTINDEAENSFLHQSFFYSVDPEKIKGDF